MLLSQKKIRTEEKEKLQYKELGNNENCTLYEISLVRRRQKTDRKSNCRSNLIMLVTKTSRTPAVNLLHLGRQIVPLARGRGEHLHWAKVVLDSHPPNSKQSEDSLVVKIFWYFKNILPVSVVDHPRTPPCYIHWCQSGPLVALRGKFLQTFQISEKCFTLNNPIKFNQLFH